MLKLISESIRLLELAADRCTIVGGGVFCVPNKLASLEVVGLVELFIC